MLARAAHTWPAHAAAEGGKRFAVVPCGVREYLSSCADDSFDVVVGAGLLHCFVDPVDIYLQGSGCEHLMTPNGSVAPGGQAHFAAWAGQRFTARRAEGTEGAQGAQQADQEGRRAPGRDLRGLGWNPRLPDAARGPRLSQGRFFKAEA